MSSTYFLNGDVEVTSDKVRIVQTEGSYVKKAKIFSVTLASFDSVGAETNSSPLYLLFFGLFLILGLVFWFLSEPIMGGFFLFASIISLISYFVSKESTVFFNTKGGNEFRIKVKRVGIDEVTTMCDEIEAQIKKFQK